MDEVFVEEQAHLSDTYAKLQRIEHDVRTTLDADLAEALKDKEDMFDEMTRDFSSDVQLETLAELEAMNRIIEGYNLSADINTEKLRRVQLLLRKPYFAKIKLKFPHSSEPKDVYIGAAGMTDEMRRHFIVDWRSPVAEVYYNQANGPTSYEANGRTINVDMQLRRQFDLDCDTLHSYFDTTVAIEDPLLLKSLSSRRTARLEAITTTIQKEQNLVIRHPDVPVLLVHGIAGSGKTSVLLQRIAYLFYTERETLVPSDVYLLSPNPVFGHYIDNVLPDMGESNPQILTWDTLMDKMGLGGRGVSKSVEIETLDSIDAALPKLQLEQGDFCDLRVEDERIVSASSVKASFDKFSRAAMGPHRITLAMEDIKDKIEQRILRLSKDEYVQERVLGLSNEEQIGLFGQQLAPLDDEEVISYTRRWLKMRYEPVLDSVDDAAWLRIDRIGRRMLNVETLDSVTWLYLKLALIGGGERHARYIMVDEVQDYTLTQLAVLERFFPHAHFLLLGDENQAVSSGTASFDEIRSLFERKHGHVDECSLMISYRSSPEITDLFTRLLPVGQRLEASSVQRPGVMPSIIECSDDEEYELALRTAVIEASEQDCLTALIANSHSRAKQLAKLLDGCPLEVLDANGTLPKQGVVLIDVKLAKGLEFDRVIVPDVHQGAFPDEPVRRHRLYTAISRATQHVTLLCNGPLNELLR